MVENNFNVKMKRNISIVKEDLTGGVNWRVTHRKRRSIIADDDTGNKKLLKI
jgi:hypothetical protein